MTDAASRSASTSLRVHSAHGAYGRDQRQLSVYLDGQIVGEVAFGDTEMFPIAPGSHSITVACGRRRSNACEFAAVAGETVKIETGIRPNHRYLFMIPLRPSPPYYAGRAGELDAVINVLPATAFGLSSRIAGIFAPTALLMVGFALAEHADMAHPARLKAVIVLGFLILIAIAQARIGDIRRYQDSVRALLTEDRANNRRIDHTVWPPPPASPRE